MLRVWNLQLTVSLRPCPAGPAPAPDPGSDVRRRRARYAGPDRKYRLALAYLLFVLGCTEQGLNGVSFGQFDLDEPAITVGIAGDQGRIAVQGLVAGHNFTGNGGVDVADALGGLDLAHHFVCRNLRANLWHLGVDDIPKGVLGKIGDSHADHAVGIRGGDPLVFGGVGQVFGNVAHGRPFIGVRAYVTRGPEIGPTLKV